MARWVELVLASHQANDSWELAHDRPKVAAALRRELESWLVEIRRLEPEVVKGELGEPDVKDIPAPYHYFLRSSHLDESALFEESDLFLWRPEGDNEKIIVFSRQGVSEKTRVFRSTFGDQVDIDQMKAEGGPIGSGRRRKGPYKHPVAEDVFFLPRC